MKSTISRLIGLAIAVTVIGVVPVFAQSSAPMTDQHIAQIKSNCQLARATLSQIRANDAPVYINRNQTYFSIGDKMMAALNSRLSLNRYDASDMVKTASEYNDEIGKFRGAYSDYVSALSDAIGTDCEKQPVEFYDKVATTRDDRQKVHDIVVQLTNDINQYRSEVQAFKNQKLSTTPESRP